MSGHHHRSGKLHQANKGHKTSGGYSTKRAVNETAHGRVEKGAIGGGVGGSIAGGSRLSIKSLSSLASTSKANRANHAKQIKDQRKAEALVAKRVGSTGNGYGPPRVVTVIGLGATANRAAAAASLLALADDATTPSGSEAFGSPLTLTFHTFRSRVTVLAPPRGGEVSTPQVQPGSAVPSVFHYDVTHTLAGAQAADVLLAVVDMAAAAAPGGPGLSGAQADWEAAVDEEGDLFMSSIKALGLPTVVGVVQGLDRLPSARQQDARRWAHRLFATEFGTDVKVVEAPDHLSPRASTAKGSAAASSGAASLSAAVSDGSALHLVRAVTSVSPKQLTWRSHRPYMLVQGMQFAADPAAAAASDSAPSGSLTLTGYLRGVPLNVHQLVSLPWAGVYQIESVGKPSAASGGDPFRPPQAGKHAKRAFAGGELAPGAPATAAQSRAYRPLDALLAPVVTALPPGANAAVAVPAPGTALVRVIAPLSHAAAGAVSSSSSSALDVVATAEEAYREPLETVAAPEGGDDEDGMGEQTWPDEEEGDGDSGDDDDEAMEGAGRKGGKKGSRRLAGGRSAWLAAGAGDDEVDMAEDSDEDEDGSDSDDGHAGAWNKPLAGDKAESAERAAALQSEAAEERERLRDRARRRALRKRGLATGSDDEEDEAAEAAPADDDGDDDDLSIGAAEDTAVDSAGADAARAAMRGNTATAAAGTGGAGASSFAPLRKTPLAAAAEIDAQFPDEVDTPVGIPARERFGRYRGLKSFRSSPWDPKESLPASYGHIFELPHFGRLQRRVLAEAGLAERAVLSLEGAAIASQRSDNKAARVASKDRAAAERKAARVTAEGSVAAPSAAGSVAGGADDDENMGGSVGDGEEGGMTVDASTTTGGNRTYTCLSDVLGPGWVAPGQLVAITLRNVPASVVASAVLPGVPLTLTALLRHENRTSVSHFAVQRYAPYADTPLCSKTPLEVHYGLPGRTIDVRPLWSTSTSAASSERSKMDRFLPGGGAWSTATAFAPVTYGPMPALFFRRIPLTLDAAAPGEPLAAPDGDVAPPHPALYGARLGALDQRAACGAPADPAVVPAGSVPAPRYRLQLVGWGSTAGSNPDRIVLKRSILSGFPVKVRAAGDLTALWLIL